MSTAGGGRACGGLSSDSAQQLQELARHGLFAKPETEAVQQAALQNQAAVYSGFLLVFLMGIYI